MKETNCVDVREFMGWHCASCDQLIRDVGAGWVEWLASEHMCGNTVLSGLRLVHRTVTDIAAARLWLQVRCAPSLPRPWQRCGGVDSRKVLRAKWLNGLVVISIGGRAAQS